MDKKYQIDPDLRSKLVKYFSTIEEMVDTLPPNLTYHKICIKGYVSRAKEYLIKHT